MGTRPGMLAGVRVVEVGDESGAYAGLLLAGLGTDVVKIEPPVGCPTRQIGPFVDDVEHPERSLFFWNYNRGKRSVVLDLDSEGGASAASELIVGADVLLDSTGGELHRAL